MKRKIIGTRHGEKLYETLISREEMARSIDMGKYFKIEIDDRDLNYEAFFSIGKNNISLVKDFTSHNTKILNQNELKKVLLNLSFIKKRLIDNFMYKIMTIVGTRPEIIKMSMTIKLFDQNTNHILVHSGQNYDYELNEVFFKDLDIRKPNYFLNASGKNASQTIGNIIKKTDNILRKEKPDALLLYGDTNSCLSAIAAKKLKIPIFHMEAGNRSFDLRIPEETNRKILDHISDINLVLTEHARRYLILEGIKPETIFKTGSHMKEVLNNYSNKINKSKILENLGLKSNNYFLISIHREENVDKKSNLKTILKTFDKIASTFKCPLLFLRTLEQKTD